MSSQDGNAWPGPFNTKEAVAEHFSTFYREDIQRVVQNNVAVSREQVKTIPLILDIILACSPSVQRNIYEACVQQPRAKKRRVEGQGKPRGKLSDVKFYNGTCPDTLFKGVPTGQVIDIIQRFVSLSNKSRSSRFQACQALSRVPGDLQRMVIEAIEASRKAVDPNPDGNRPTLTSVGNSQISSTTDEFNWQTSSFLQVPDKNVIRMRMQEFIDRTSNAALAMVCCASCAREIFQRECQRMDVEDIPSKNLLHPVTPHPKQQLTDGMLLFPRSYRTNEPVDICHECVNQLERGKRPPLSLANDMWIGDVPKCLQGLTLPERILIARYLPVAHVVKLYPKTTGTRGIRPDQLHSGLRGNVSSYPLDQRQIADMITPVKPAPLSVLSATIAITFVGRKNAQLKWLHGRLPGNLSVRREKVRRALTWLQANNPLYANIEVSEERLKQLPLNAVPVELLQVTRISDDEEGLDQEHMNYVPTAHDDGDDQGSDGTTTNEAQEAHWAEVGLCAPQTHFPPFEEELSLRWDCHGSMEPLIDVDIPSYPGHWVEEAAWDDVGEARSGGESDDEDEAPLEFLPAVIPFEALGVIDINGESIPDRELRAHAFANATNENSRRTDYYIRHGSAFVNEYARKDPVTGHRFDGGPDNPNHLLGCFPWLFPYGRGGFELKKERDVSYEAHSKWALQYGDKRFRTDSHFMFMVFGVLQKRQVCRSVQLQITRRGIERHADVLAALTPEDLLQASKEETARRPHKHPGVRCLDIYLRAVRRRVAGTDENRFVVRSQAWGNTLMFNQASLWMTLNPADTQCPIAQVLVGEAIDLDAFSCTAGPDGPKRARNIAGDPYASAKYFHFIITAVLEILLGISPSHGGRPPQRREGIFGWVQSYIGTVEAQGRGTLHLHVLVWLSHSPTPSQLKAMLQSEAFRLRVREFLESLIVADVGGRNDAQMKVIPKQSDVSYSRPTDPTLENYEEVFQQKQLRLARTLQYHKCGPTTCQKLIRGSYRCKARAPWPKSEETWVDENGEYGIKRFAEFLNSWCPWLLDAMRCNHDIRLLLATFLVAKIIWYITNYATKKQQRSTNVTAVLAKRLAFHLGQEQFRPDVEHRNKRLLERCANALTREREFSGPEVATLLMGWGDRYQSHVYVPIFWDQADKALKEKFPSLRTDGADADSDDSRGISLASGTVELQDQLKDYQYRAHDLQDYSFFDFLLSTYEETIREKMPAGDMDGTDNELHNGNPGESSGPGRPRNARFHYLPGAGKSKKCRVLRVAGHETMPRIAGRWLPPNDEPSVYPLYCASVLLLLKPWRNLEDLLNGLPTFENSFAAFASTCSARDRRVMENLQFYHTCARDAKADSEAAWAGTGRMAEVEEDSQEGGEVEEDTTEASPEAIDHALEQMLNAYTDEQITAAEKATVADRELLYAHVAVMKAKASGVFEDADSSGPPTVVPDSCRQATDEELSVVGQWKTILAATTRDLRTANDTDDTGEVTQGELVEIEVAGGTGGDWEPGVLPQINGEDSGEDLVAKLNEEQRRAHDIILEHLNGTLEGITQEQLLMQVQGEGGTGKSMLIAAVTSSFERMGAAHLLAKTATTGIAAVPIGGSTVHSWARIPVNVPNAGDDWVSQGGPQRREERIRKIAGKQYLIVDEVSMMTKKMLWNLNQVVTSAKLAGETGDRSRPFGGMNVILFGDFHQFPPVSNAPGALYCDRPNMDTNPALLGRELFKSFDKVVILKKQNRSQDLRWNELLGRLREGLCTDADIAVLNALVLKRDGPGAVMDREGVLEEENNACDSSDDLYPLPDFYQAPWDQAILVTPRHVVRQVWNEHALMKLSRTSGKVRYVVTATDKDTKTGKAPTPAVLLAMAGKPERDGEKGRLERRIELVEGMSLMILSNVATEADVANGTRGTLEKILFDPREPPSIISPEGVCKLKYLPVALWIRPVLPCRIVFPGVPEGLIPLTPQNARYTGVTASKRRYNVHREQFHVTPAYAFTDYKSQAQTIEKVIVDIGKPPSGSISPFNVYVALSRSRGREHIRLLREFDETLVTRHPSEVLREEMTRLRRLDVETKTWWESRNDRDRQPG